jgi:ubiquitin carboxyl-terminal hydrolase 25/28
MIELDTIIAELSTRNQSKIPHVPVPALKDIERSLGCFDYPKRSRTVDLSIEEHPHYASLGAVDQFTDDFLGWAYDRQCECDPANKPYYLDCLADIAKGRESSDLETKVVMATSAGEHGLKEIEAAFKFFALDPATSEGDDHIIGVYTARIDSAPRQKDEARQCLRVIASARQSARIEAVANDQTISVSEALEILNVTEDTPSDSIQAAAVVMVSLVSEFDPYAHLTIIQGLDGDKSRVIRALKVISSHRKGDYVLEAAAANMESGGEQTLAISDAYARLQIGDRNVPDETVLTYYQSLSGDAPAGSKDSYTEALRAIALDRSSTFLLMKLDNPDADVRATRTTSDEPVGLENIGNTCYLNSLLQFYYTIKPVRDVVMNFESYRVDPDDQEISTGKKRVGGRVVDRAEVVKAQKCKHHSIFKVSAV